MDIVINKNIEYEDLQTFLSEFFIDRKLFLSYEGVNDLNDSQNQEIFVQYLSDDELQDGYKFSLSVFLKCEDILPVLENLASSVSARFNCSAFCDASRLILKEHNYYYSLLFDSNKVYLIDDSTLEETGRVTKIIELKYELPRL